MTADGHLFISGHCLLRIRDAFFRPQLCHDNMVIATALGPTCKSENFSLEAGSPKFLTKPMALISVFQEHCTTESSNGHSSDFMFSFVGFREG